MSPFSRCLHELRMRHGIRQSELADLMGYEQSYISALEIGTKGPPTQEFVEKLAQTLELSADQRSKIHEAARASQRRLVLDSDSSTELFLLISELREQLHALHPAQIKLIREALGLKSSLVDWQPEPVRRIRRRRKEEATM